MLCSDFGDIVVLQLTLANRVHDFDAGEDDACAPEILETQSRLDDALDGTVILLDDVVQVSALADLDRRRPCGVILQCVSRETTCLFFQTGVVGPSSNLRRSDLRGIRVRRIDEYISFIWNDGGRHNH
jgi:hypothetical protein